MMSPPVTRVIVDAVGPISRIPDRCPRVSTLSLSKEAVMRRCAFLLIRGVAVVLLTSGCGGIDYRREETSQGLRCATFECDVTPPVGHPLCGGGRIPAESILAPLLAKGVVLADGPDRYVVCVMDWCRLQ